MKKTIDTCIRTETAKDSGARGKISLKARCRQDKKKGMRNAFLTAALLMLLAPAGARASVSTSLKVDPTFATKEACENVLGAIKALPSKVFRSEGDKLVEINDVDAYCESLFPAQDEITQKITALYHSELQRAPDPEGLAYWVNEVKTGKYTIAQVKGHFIWCRSLPDDHPDRCEPGRDFNGGGGTGTGTGTSTSTSTVTSDGVPEAISQLYRTILKREPDSAGLDYWVDEVRTGKQTVPTVQAHFLWCSTLPADDDNLCK